MNKFLKTFKNPMLANGYTVKISILYVKSSCTGLQDIRIPMLSLQ